MLTFKYSEFAHLIESDPIYMIAVGLAMAVFSCGCTIAVFELLKPLVRKRK
ncbi:hypothetical protein [Alteromonas phage PB15]|nr:hypothetical protein [Alteromonas phage PB15]